MLSNTYTLMLCGCCFAPFSVVSYFIPVSNVHGARKVDVKKRYAEGMERYNSWKARRDVEESIPGPSTEEMLGLEAGEHLTDTSKINTAIGTIKEKLTETYEGLPVFGQSVVVESDDGEPTGEIVGHLIEGIEEDIPNVDPQLSDDEILDLAVESWGDELEDILDGTVKTSLEIYVIDDENSPDVIPILAYQLSYITVEEGRLSRPTFIIDANTGETILSWEGMTTRSPQLEGKGYYDFHAVGGNVKMGKLRYGTDLPALRVWMDEGMCYLHNEKVTVIDGSSFDYSNFSHSFSFPCEQGFNDSINGGYSPLADGFFFGNIAYDVFYEWLGVPPLTHKVVMIVHHGYQMDSALWTGEVALFGDGYSKYYPFITLDVAAHEMAHGFTEQNSELVNYGMSGGMDESFSDIAGAAAEAYMKESDWQIGNDVIKAENEAMRYFEDPNLDGRSLGHMDDYCKHVNAHFNSGIYNRAWYLLTTTPGWNVRMSFQVMATANQLYWTPDSTFNDGACGVMQAARDLGYNDADVEAAFNGVGINPCGPSLEGLFLVMGLSGAPNETLYFYFDLEDDIDLLKFETYGSDWSGEYTMTVQTPSGMVLSNSSTSKPVHVSDPETGRFTVTVTISGNNGYFSDVNLYAIGGSYILTDTLDWQENGRAKGSFTIPENIVNANTAVAVRTQIPDQDIFDGHLFFGITYEGEVDIDNNVFNIRSERLSNDQGHFYEAILCKAKSDVYNYEMASFNEQIPEGLRLVAERLIIPTLVWEHHDWKQHTPHNLLCYSKITCMSNNKSFPNEQKNKPNHCNEHGFHEKCSLFRNPCILHRPLPVIENCFNSWHAKLFRGNMNIYLHFMSCLHIDMSQVVEIPSRIRPGLAYFT